MSFQERTRKAGIENRRQIFVESELEKKAHTFILYFLFNTADQKVSVEEVEEIDFLRVIQHLDRGGEIFIGHRDTGPFQKEEPDYVRRENGSVNVEQVEVYPLSSEGILGILGALDIKGVDRILSRLKWTDTPMGPSADSP